MPKVHKPSPSLDALVIHKECKRYLVVIHGDIRITVEDDDAKSERPAVVLLDKYCAEYQAELAPHIAKLTKLRRLALAIRRENPRLNLP